MDRAAYLRTAAIWAGGGLLASYAWEMLQMPLYEGLTPGTGWRSCFVAALGDVAILAVLYTLMAAASRSWLWVRRLSLARTMLLVALGALLATAVELHALSQGRWSYDASMPRLPVLAIGLVPLLQMTLIPLGLAWLSHRWAPGRSGWRP